MIQSSKRKLSEKDQDSRVKRGKNESAKPSNLLRDNTVFGELLLGAGAILRSNGSSVELTNKQSIFQRTLTKLVKSHRDYPQVVEEFAAGLSSQIEDPARLRLLLIPTTVLSDNEDEILGSGQSGLHDSLIRLLLGIEYLQPKVITVLLERLVEFTDQNDRGDSGHGCLPKLIMNQFRWLDHVINAKDVVDKMLEVASITSLEIQREIISCLPEVVDDLQHSEVAKLLKDMLSDNRLLMPTILDVLTNLTFSPDLLAEVRDVIIEVLPSMELDNLPVVIRFLLQTVSAVDAFQVVNDLRSHLDLTVIDSTSASTPHPGSSKRDEKAQGSIKLILESILSGVRFQKFVAEAWLKVIESVKLSSDHKVVDILVLLILHSCGYRKQVETLSRSRIASGHFTHSLLQLTFSAHGQVLRDYFTSVLIWAEVLLRSPQPIIGGYARSIYKQAFVAFDAYCQQEIVGNLVTHIGSGYPSEIESSLDILTELITEQNKLMAPFAVFIKGVLDYIDNLNMTQIRKLYRMLGCLAFGSDAPDSVIQDSLHMMIRKQLSNTNVRYQQMGVLGTISVVMNLAHKHGSSAKDAAGMQTESRLPETSYQQSVSLLQLAKNSCGRSPDSLALFLEELAAIVREGSVHSKVEEWIADNVINDFQDDFVVDMVAAENEGMDPLPWNLAFGLDNESESSIVLNLLPLVVPSRQLTTSRLTIEKLNATSRSVSVWWMASNFRLLQICESRLHNGDLEGIDALLGCPVKFPRMDVINDKLESLSSRERHILCDCLFLAINWFREVINAFANQRDKDLKAKVIQRLHLILELQQLLERCLKGLTDYVPPPSVFEASSAGPISIVGPKKNAARGKGKKLKATKGKKKASNDEDNDSSDNEEIREETQIGKENEEPEDPQVDSASTFCSKALIPFFRELDFDVLNLLNIEFYASPDISSEEKKKRIALEPPLLLFLLNDLALKLNHRLISHETRVVFFKSKADKGVGFRLLNELNTVTLVEKVVDLLPALCQQIEAIGSFFQAIYTADDGLIDGPHSGGTLFSVVASCMGLLLQSLLSLFSWSGFLQTTNSCLHNRALSVLAGRLSTGSSTQLPFADLVRVAYSYLENLKGCVPNLNVAVKLSKLLNCLSMKTGSKELCVKTGETVLLYLKRAWLGIDGKPEKGALHNENLQSLLRLYFQCSDQILVALENLASTAVPELMKADKNNASVTFPTLTRNSYHVFYRMMLQELVGHVKSIIPGKQSDPQQENVDKLLTWNVSVRIFHILVSLSKSFDARPNLTAILKFGRQFVETFLRCCMPMLDHMFRSHREDIQSLLKNLQLSTRALQHICGHSKIMKDIQLTNQVPQVKKILEVFVYRVKAMLTMNRCLEAFWLGNLKNRNLKGDEIMSQISQTDASSSSEDSLPEDENDDEDSRSNGPTAKKTIVSSAGEDSGDESESYSEAF